MADLTDSQAAQSIKIVGSSSTGLEQTPVKSSNDGSLHALTHGRFSTTDIPIAVDSGGRIITTNEVVSVLPSAKISFFSFLNTGITDYETYPVVARTAVKQMLAGGTGAGICTLARYVAATSTFLNEGDFESAGAFGTTWVASSPGTGLTSFAQSATQVNTGSFSGRVIYSKSDSNNYVNVRQTFSPTLDLTGWRYITAKFYHDTPAGGVQTRVISIILTSSNGSTRTYSLSFLTTAAAGWQTINGELENPTSSTGTGFDASDVTSIDLRFVDTGSKAGTVYWDTVKKVGAITPLVKVYWQANSTINLAVDPVEIFEIGDTLMLITKNSDTARKEYSVFASGVAL